VTVVVPGELHEQVAAGVATGQPDRGHGRFGSGRHEPDLLDGRDATGDHARLHELSQLGLGRSRCAKGEAERGSILHGANHIGLGVAENGGPPRADEVNVFGAVSVGHIGAGGLHQEARGSSDRAEGTNGRVHATGNGLLGAREEGVVVHLSHPAASVAQ
jgi:hypothetical protein